MRTLPADAIALRDRLGNVVQLADYQARHFVGADGAGNADAATACGAELPERGRFHNAPGGKWVGRGPVCERCLIGLLRLGGIEEAE